MSKKNPEADEAARFAGLGAAAIINFGSGMTPAQILAQASVYEAFIVSGQRPPAEPEKADPRPKAPANFT
jgi:hypothetical protein